MLSEHEIEQKLRSVRFTTSPEQDDRILRAMQAKLSKAAQTASDAESATPDSAQSAEAVTENRPRQRGRRFLFVKCCAAALAGAVLILAVFQISPGRSDGWAQVVEAVRTKPWIHIKSEVPDEGVVEQWFSLSREISAERHRSRASFTDHRAGIAYEFDTKKGVLTRRPETSKTSRTVFLEFASLFRQLFQMKERLEVDLPGMEILKQDRRTVEDAGRKWVEYELVIGAPQGVNLEPDEQKCFPVSIVFRVDPDSGLPHSMTLSGSSTETKTEPESMTGYFSFPDPGPGDIYALEVPRDAKLVDYMPDLELARVLEGVRTAQERFDNYYAIGVWTVEGAPWHEGTPVLVWRKAGKSRVEWGLIDPDAPAVEPPALDADRRAWWAKRLDHLWFVPHEVYDGKQLHFNDAAKPAGWEKMILPPLRWSQKDWPAPKWSTPRTTDAQVTGSLHFAYPPQLTEIDLRHTEVTIEDKPETGPPNTMVLTLRSRGAEPDSPATRFWIDRDRSWLCVRYELPSFTMEVLSTAKSPRGFSYPTEVRWTSTETNQADGTSTTRQFRWTYFLDFDADMPDALFKPAVREPKRADD